MDDQQTKDYQDFRKSINSASFSTKAYSRKIQKPWGYEVHFVPDDIPYMGKLLYVDEGKQNSLQAHDLKQESWYWAGGEPIIIIENANEQMEEIILTPGQGYTCAIGQKHRLKGGKGGGVFFEVSTPEKGTTFRIEDDYSRPSETEDLRAERNQQAE